MTISSVKRLAPSPEAALATDHLISDIGQRSRRGGTILLVAQAVRVAAQLATMVVLVRLLSPSAFGLLAMVGKAERGPAAVEAIRDHRSAYLMAVGGAAYLVARAIKGSRVVGFADLGMEAIYEFEVQDFPVTVAVDAEGNNVHQLAPLVWRERIARERLLAPA